MEHYADKSFWLATYGSYTHNPPLQGDLAVDVAIIGGGFTGLATAINLRKDDPGLSVAVFEAEAIGFGASGRNGGFSMTLFGLEPAVTKTFFGHQRTIEAHRYMECAVDYVDSLIQEHHIQSDYWFPGFLRAATTPGYAVQLQTRKRPRVMTHGCEGGWYFNETNSLDVGDSRSDIDSCLCMEYL